MKNLQNTLFVTTQGAYVCHDGESIVVRVEQETRLRIPVHTLSGIMCFGQVLCSPPVLGLCAERGVEVSFLTEHGRFLGRLEGAPSGNVLLRKEQYRRSDNPGQAADLARAMVLGKAANARTVLQRALRDHGGDDGLPRVRESARRLGRLISEFGSPLTLDEVRGKEGEASHMYFAVFDDLITAQKEDFFFHERSRRPPMDNMNALLSFLYTMLAHDAASALCAAGLDPQVGFLHRDRPGRPSLALDLMEEFRPFLADRLALSLVNRRQIEGRGFKKTESGAVIMSDETRKEVIVAYQKRKQEEIEHPFLGDKMQVGLLVHMQALLLARHLRGDLEAYPPFVWR